MRFRAPLQLDGKTATGITVPPEVMAELAAGKRPKVRVALAGHTYRSTVGAVDGAAKIPVSADVRRAAGIEARRTTPASARVEQTVTLLGEGRTQR